jgi:SAM-dependent methyltransferase
MGLTPNALFAEVKRTPSNIPAKIRDLVRASREAAVLFAAAETGIFDAVGPRGDTADQVSRKKRLNKRAVEIVLNTLAGIGFLRKRADRYFNLPFAKRCLLTGSPDSVIESLLLGNRTNKAWSALDQILRTGAGAAKQTWERGDIRRETTIFARAMFVGAKDAARALPEMADLGRCRTLIDIGGGAGHFSYHLCKQYPRLTATILDLPLTVRLTRRYLKEYGLGKRMRAVAGDFEKGELPGGFDAALLSQIIHSLGEKGNAELVAKVYRCLNPGGIIILRDFFLNPDRTSPPNAALFAVNMLVNTKGGRTYALDEAKAWMRAAGFTKITRLGPPAFGDSSVLTALKPA